MTRTGRIWMLRSGRTIGRIDGTWARPWLRVRGRWLLPLGRWRKWA